jgi:hypothetical protein
VSGGRIPSPGPSFVRDDPLRLRWGGPSPGDGVGGQEPGPELILRLGMSVPSVMPDGWWLTQLWAEDERGVVEARDAAPPAGPPPGVPLQVMGPVLAGSLAGLLAHEGGRALIRLRMPAPPDDARPWQRPLLLWVAVRWDPVRASTMRRNELARELLRAFRRAVIALASAAPSAGSS